MAADGWSKDDDRSGRLTVTNKHVERLRKEFLADARKECKPLLAAYAACSERAGFWTPFKCRQENREMNACLAKITTNDNFNVFKERRCAELGWEVPDAPLRKKSSLGV